MAVNLSIKNVPDELAARLRERAARNHRSLQGELMAIVEGALEPNDAVEGMTENPVRYRAQPSDQLAARVRDNRPRLHWPSEAARLIRDSRDIDGAFENTPNGPQRMRRLSPSQVLARARGKNIRVPGDIVDMIRKLRDER